MDPEIPALYLSVFSTIISVASVYLAQFKRGKFVVPEVRAYRTEPMNYTVNGDSFRGLRLILMTTVMNTGAMCKSIANMRIRLIAPDKSESLLFWELEYENLSAQQGTFASQPTLEPYGSLSTVYSFVSSTTIESGEFIQVMEEQGTANPEVGYRAQLQVLEGDKWSTVRSINIHYRGAFSHQTSFELINSERRAA